MTKPKHPMQRLVWDGDVIRFQANSIVRYLLDRGGIDLNQIARLNFDHADRRQFAQLIGYSVSGYGDLGEADPKSIRKADKRAKALIKARDR